MNWRTWNYDSIGPQLQANSFFFNQLFVDKGFLYHTYDATLHQESNFDFGYQQHKPVTRFVMLDADSTHYIGWDGKYAALFDPGTAPGTSFLRIDTLRPAGGDLRVSPLPKKSPNYHVWDMNFFQGDLLQILPQMIANCKSTGILEEKQPENTTLIYPNPSNGIVHVSNGNQRIKNIRLFNLQGVLIKAFFTNDFSVSDLTAGIYFITVQSDQSTFTGKLVKQ